jgi:hypothetical protein
MLSKRYRLKLATWTVVREPGQPSPRRLNEPESVAALVRDLVSAHADESEHSSVPALAGRQAAKPGRWRSRPYLRRIPRSVVTSNRPVSSRSKRDAR